MSAIHTNRHTTGHLPYTCCSSCSNQRYFKSGRNWHQRTVITGLFSGCWR